MRFNNDKTYKSDSIFTGSRVTYVSLRSELDVQTKAYDER